MGFGFDGTVSTGLRDEYLRCSTTLDTTPFLSAAKYDHTEFITVC